MSFAGVFTSEWLKARSLRSTWWLSGSALLATAAITAFWTVAGPTPTEANVMDAVATGFFACEIVLLLIGTLIATSDYENHGISVYFAAVPRRTPIVVAKALLAALFGLVVSSAAALIGFAVSVALHGGGASLALPEVWRVLGDMVLYGTCVSVIAAMIGLVFRSTIAAVGVTLGFLYVVPILVSLVPLDAFVAFSETFPGKASSNFFATAVDPAHLDPIGGAVATVAWTLAWVAFGVVWIRRRNA